VRARASESERESLSGKREPQIKFKWVFLSRSLALARADSLSHTHIFNHAQLLQWSGTERGYGVQINHKQTNN